MKPPICPFRRPFWFWFWPRRCLCSRCALWRRVDEANKRGNCALNEGHVPWPEKP